MRTIRFLPISLALSLSACGAPGGGGETESTPDPDPEPGVAWQKQLTGPESQDAMAITVDAAGRVVVAGSSKGVADLGAGFEMPAGANDLFVSVLGPSGDTAFARRFSATNVTCTDVATDAEGHIVVTGLFSDGPLQIGDTVLTPAGYTDGFVAELSPDGDPLWARSFGGAGLFSAGGALAIADDGAVVEVGNLGTEIHVLRVSPAGEVQLEHHEGSLSSPFSFFSAVKSAAIGANGDVYVTGSFVAEPQWKAELGPMVVDDGWLLFVARLSGATGQPVWAKAYGDPQAFYNNNGDAIAVDAAGDVLVSGTFAGTLDFGGGALPGRVFVTKLAAADGAHLWSRGFGEEPSTTQLVLDPEGRPVLLSSLEVGADIDGTPMPAGSYLAELSASDGQIQRTRSLPELGSMVSETENGFFGLGEMAIGPSGEIAVLSSFYGTYTTSLGTFSSAGWSDILVVHLPGW